MAKINVDIDVIKKGLKDIGYNISDCIERENNGKNWQLKFANSGAIVTIYDSNKVKNSVVNGKAEKGESEALKKIVDALKCRDMIIDPLNEIIVNLIELKREADYYDYKQEVHGNNECLLHDILCMANNIENRDAYIIFGVTDAHEVVGLNDGIKSNDIYDFMKHLSFAGDHMPEIEIKSLYYKYKKIGVIVCKSSKYVPFYLSKSYKGIQGGKIYTRVGDTNTPKNEYANYIDTEKLWRIHFQREND